MRTAIVYASSHGTTEKVARRIATELQPDEVVILNIKKEKGIDLATFDKVIIGGSIHAGGIQKSIKEFVTKYQSVLITKKLGVFVCGMDPNAEKQQQELEAAYPQLIREKARITTFMGGEFLFEKMNIFERMIVKKIAKTDKSVSALKNDAIEHFINTMKS